MSRRQNILSIQCVYSQEEMEAETIVCECFRDFLYKENQKIQLCNGGTAMHLRNFDGKTKARESKA